MVCKSIAKASKVRILHLPPRAGRALDQRKRRSWALSFCPGHQPSPPTVWGWSCRPMSWSLRSMAVRSWASRRRGRLGCRLHDEGRGQLAQHCAHGGLGELMQEQPVELPAEGSERRVVAAGESQLRLVRSHGGDLEVSLHHREQLGGPGSRPPELYDERLSTGPDVADMDADGLRQPRDGPEGTHPTEQILAFVIGGHGCFLPYVGDRAQQAVPNLCDRQGDMDEVVDEHLIRVDAPARARARARYPLNGVHDRRPSR